MTVPLLKSDESFDQPGYVGRIPVRNLWLLMLYASDLFKELNNTAKHAIEDNPDDIPNLVAEMLCRRVEHRIQRNLSHGYLSRQRELTRVRGTIDFLTTERKMLLSQGKVACRFQELTIDTARNRLVRAALEEISKVIRTDNTLAHRSRALATSLRRLGVTGNRPNRAEMTIDRFGLHDVADQPMVTTAHLALDLALPTENIGTRLLSDPAREIRWLRTLYEKAIGGFYRVALHEHGWRTEMGKFFHWQKTNSTEGIDTILPSMKTDIVLSHSAHNKRIIIDTKFNSLLSGGWYRKESIRNGYLYQIYAYLRSQETNNDPMAENASGLLLHPCIGNSINESVVIQNHKIKFATVDLSASAKDIQARLLEIVSDCNI